MNKWLIITMIIIASFNAISGEARFGERGHFWCGERFLPPMTNHFGANEENIAVKGYIYVLAAALALQQNNDEGKAHWFITPKRMEVINPPVTLPSGFKAITFLIKPLDPSHEDEIVVAFTGSDQGIDWTRTNIMRSRSQFKDAENYILSLARSMKIKDKKIIVTGISLGGGLAVYVTKNDNTSKYIKQAWAINPSPVTFSNNDIDNRIWLVYAEGEVLSFVRKALWLTYLRGIGNIGAPYHHTGKDFTLVKSNSVYAHFRWVITREVLFVADYAMTKRGTKLFETEPYNILKRSSFQSCKNPEVLKTTE